MNKIKIYIFLFALILFIGDGYGLGLNFHGSASNSVYHYEDVETHTRLYQFLRFSLDSPELNNVSLNASLRALTDVDVDLEDDARFKAYNLNIKAKKLFNRLDVVFGRQFLHPGTVLGGLDGLYLKYHLSPKLAFTVYGGVESHFQRSFKIYKAEDSFTSGGVFELKKIFQSNMQFLYLRKSTDEEVFWHLTGWNFDSKLIPYTRLRVQAHYDIENSQLHRLYLSTRHTINKNFLVTLGYKSQYPQVYANSFYTIFEIDAYQQYQLGCTYKLFGNFFLNGQYRYLKFDTEDANQIFATISHLNGSLGLIYESGYSGEQLGIIADYAYSITPNLIASASVDYTKYKTETVYDYETDNQLANAVRVAYRFKKHWTIDLEYQWINNDRFEETENDSRILNHIQFSW